jgi:protein-disulfide isomerase
MTGAERLTNFATGVLVCCALIVTTILVRREFLDVPRSIRTPAVAVQKDWKTYAASGHTLGPADSKVTIVEFADFECPYCRRFNSDVDSLRSLGKSFKVVYRHFPLPIHRFAIPAARASECASDQARFDEMYAALYSHRDSLGIAPWLSFARMAHIPDHARFDRCMREAKPIAALQRDTADGRHLHVTGTPTLLIGSLRVDGLPSFDSLVAYIDRARGSQSALSNARPD